MIQQSPFAAMVAGSVFEDIDRLLDRPDCKKARALVRQRRQVYALRHEREAVPLRISIPKKGTRKWVKRAILVALACAAAISAISSLQDVYRTSADRAREGTPRTITAPSQASPESNPSFEYHSPEAP